MKRGSRRSSDYYCCKQNGGALEVPAHLWVSGHPVPQYSPDLNPIQMPFSKLKASLRKAAERTIPCARRIGKFACTLTAREARNYFQARRL
jgi:transposase